ncbi:hypothetical protein BCI9360_00131 [Bacillus sp. CECT 9360]|nr:hypothetical protein BCI9360_00131 [Bacillus sp. CECT 9360]
MSKGVYQKYDYLLLVHPALIAEYGRLLLSLLHIYNIKEADPKSITFWTASLFYTYFVFLKSKTKVKMRIVSNLTGDSPK